jgi:acyl-CoA synthetase (NDP forming)
VAAPAEALTRLRAEGIVVFSAGERAVEAAAALARHAEFMRVAAARPAQAAAAPLAPPPGLVDGVQPSVQATGWLRAAGVPVAPVALAQDEDQAVALWRAAGTAVALKIESPDITHKTEVGGVLLKLDDEAAVRQAFRTLMQRARSAVPHARLDGVLVQAMASGHLELVVGVQRDPAFGMVVMVGLGGVLVEVLKDVAFRRAPFGPDEGLAMLRDLRMGALLDGVRGQPGVDRAVLAQMLSTLSHWAAGMAPWLSELDLNPVLVGPAGPTAVDCVMVLRHDPGATQAQG